MKHIYNFLLISFACLIPMHVHAFSVASISSLVTENPRSAIAGTALAAATLTSVALYYGIKYKIQQSYKKLNQQAYSLEQQYKQPLAIYHNKQGLSDVELFVMLESHILSIDAQDTQYKNYLKKLRSEIRAIRFNRFMISLSSGNSGFKKFIDNLKSQFNNLETFIAKAKAYKEDCTSVKATYAQYTFWIERMQNEEDVSSVVRTAILATGSTRYAFLNFDRHLAYDLRLLQKIHTRTSVRELKDTINTLLAQLGDLRKALHSTYEYKEERRERAKKEKLDHERWLLLDYSLQSQYRPIIIV